MKTIANEISTQFLPRVSNPGQYIGLETNRLWRPPAEGDVTVAMAFPDTYAIGFSHLGSQVLYTMLNRLPGVRCDRSYCPLPDAEEVLRRLGLPLFGWESRAPLRQFDLVGFSLAYEICVTNVLTMLDLSGIPLRAADRTERDPIILGGDAMADTPEPMADFIDLFLPGDGEVTLPPLVELVRRMKAAGSPREEILLEAARTLPSTYAPRFYRPRESSAGLQPLRDGLPATIRRAHLPRMADSPTITAPLVPLSEAVHERVVIEIMRGCPNGCRFCQAGFARLPVRFRPVEEILDQAKAAIDATGFHEIALLSLSTSDYPHLGELIAKLSAEFTPRHVSISLPSLRVDSQLRELPKLTSEVRKGGLTIAAEAGTDRLRAALRKEITENDMLAGVRAAYAAGWRKVKVYFMAGLPGETPSDIDEIFHLCRRLSDARREVDGQRGAISASVSWFVPKPHTPLQWCPMQRAEYFWTVRNRLRELCRRTPVSIKFHRIERSILEALLCRGDRRVGAIIEAAWRGGCRLDSWDEHFDFAKWQAAITQSGLDVEPFMHRDLPPGLPTPWSHIACYRGEEFLLDQYRAMLKILQLQGTETGDRQ